MDFDFAHLFLDSAPLSRRKALAVGSWGIFAALEIAGVSASAADGKTYELRAAGPALQQVKAVVELSGELKLNADGRAVERLPLTVAAEMHYSERALPVAANTSTEAPSHYRTVRHYHTAEAAIRIKETETKQTLRTDRRLIGLHLAGDAATLYSPLGPLSREELELVAVPGTSVALGNLLPGKSVIVGATWKLSDAAVTLLVHLDAVAQHDVTCKLDEVKDGIAYISATGKISGAAGGVSSEIELQGKLNFDLKQRCITWLAMSLQEDRAVGHAQPGYETRTRIRLVAAPAANLPELGDKQLAGLALDPGAGSTLLELTTEKGGYALLHDRGWHVMTDRYDVAVMRHIDRGDLVAQCNISKLPPLPKGQQLTLEGFQQDVKKSLGKSFGQFVEAGEDKTDAGVRVLRATVSGFASELPIQWTYYHLSDDQGHRASLVFTTESKLVERYAHLDREVINGFRFLDLPSESKEPTLAPAKVESAKKPATAAEKSKKR